MHRGEAAIHGCTAPFKFGHAAFPKLTPKPRTSGRGYQAPSARGLLLLENPGAGSFHRARNPSAHANGMGL